MKIKQILPIAALIIGIGIFGCSSNDDDTNEVIIQKHEKDKSAIDDNKAVMLPSHQRAKTTIYLIKHAEKADNSADPNLSAAGLLRAENWAVIFQGINFGGFYSTAFNRTMQTIQPTANGQEIITYDPFNFVLADVINNHYGRKVLIVGHSNTIPQLINQYIGEEVYPELSEFEFGNLYKVTVQGNVVSHEMTVHN